MSASSSDVTANTEEMTEQHYDDNLQFQTVRANVLTRLLTREDKKLIANLIDQTGHVILHESDLKQIIAAMKNTTVDDIKFEIQETVVTTCLKRRVLPFKKIISFSGLTERDKELLEARYHISVSTVYDEPFVHMEES